VSVAEPVLPAGKSELDAVSFLDSPVILVCPGAFVNLPKFCPPPPSGEGTWIVCLGFAEILTISSTKWGQISKGKDTNSILLV